MILQALVKRYEDFVDIPFWWQLRDVDFAINIDDNGNILDIIDIRQHENNRKIRRTLLLPEAPRGRTSNIKAAFLCDSSGYLLGDDRKRGDEKFAASSALHRRVLLNVDTPYAVAIRKFFDNAISQPLPRADSDKADVCTFMINNRFAYEDTAICNAWTEFSQPFCEGSFGKGNRVFDLVRGTSDEEVELHGLVELRGVTMGRVPLVSINAESFSSYGKTASDSAAQIGVKSAFSYTTALNELLGDEKHHQFLSDDTLVYWAAGKDDAEAETFSWFSNPKEGDSEKLSSVMEHIAEGRLIDLENISWEKPFYVLCLSPNAGRISVRFFWQSTFGVVIEKLANHYQNIEIYSSLDERFKYLPYWILLSETTVTGKASDAVPLLGGQLMRSILTGQPYPMTLYNSIIARIRSGSEINRAKAAIIKAVLIRNFNESEVTTLALNENSERIPYNLGRLFSTLERLQEKANGSSTIRQRYFASASANPASAFPTLLKLSVHHADKIEGIYFEKLKGEILSKIDNFPTSLNLQEQGEFILGYYHQTQYFFTSKKDREAAELI